MKISKLFHWLYATLMFLPLIALPIFGIYSHRHTIDSGTIEVSQNEIVDFNQRIPNTYVDYDWSTFDNYYIFLRLDYKANDIYYFRSIPSASQLIDNSRYYQFYYEGSEIQYVLGESTFTYPTNGTLLFSYVRYEVDNEYIDYDGYINLFNLTQMFGSGNEPTIQEFNQLYNADFYSYTLSRKDLLKDTSTITYSDTDIMSQFTYQIYNLESKYLNFDNVFGFGNVYDWLALNIFSGNPSIYFTMFWHLLTYWLIVSLFWLVFDVLMYVPQLAHRWLDRGAIE